MNPTAQPSPSEREAVLFALAIEKPAAERPALLQAVCAGDAALRQRLEALLAAHEQTCPALDSPPPAARPTVKLDLPEPDPDYAIGQRIGRYKLLEKIGEGGCGAVYVAEQTEPVRRRVALKVIKLGMDSKAVVARFEAERQALALMDHPNIAKVLDAGTTEGGQSAIRNPQSAIAPGRPYFVMELVRGIRITDYCDQANLSTKERLDLFIKVCHAIQHAHQKGIIHRDIKPSNILVTLHDGVPVPKVIDFGIAKATEGRLTDATVYTQLHQFIGTPAYMSPEQAEMSGLDVDTRSDIYSLGVLLYELLTGKTPFDPRELMSGGIDAMRRTIREKEPVRPSTRLATLPGEELTTTAKRRGADTSKLLHQLRGDLDWIVMKCLEKDRARRYETANGLAMDIQRHLNNEPVLARPPSVGYRLQRAWRRNRLTYTAAGTVAVALVIAHAIAVVSLARERAARRSAVQARQEAERSATAAERARAQAMQNARIAQLNSYAADMKAAEQYLRDGNFGAARALLDRHVPQPGHPDQRGWEWRYFRDRAEGDHPTILRGHTSTVAKVRFSPNGRFLASLGLKREPEGNLVLWDLQPRGGRHKWIDRRDARDFGFARDGRLGVVTDDGRLVLVAPGGHEEGEVAFESGASRVLFSPTADFAAVKIKDGPVWWLNLTTKAVQPVFGGRRVELRDISDDGARLCGTAAGKIFVWDLKAATMLVDGRGSDTSPLAFLPSGSRIIQADWSIDLQDRLIEVEALASADPDLRPQDLPRAFVGSYPGLNQFAINRAADLLAASSYNHYLALWRLSDLKPIRLLHGHQDEAWSVAISPDGRLVASGGQDRLVLVWNLDEAEAGNTVNPDTDYNRFPVFSADGVWVAVVGRSQTVSIVDLEQRRVTLRLPQAGIPLRFEAGKHWLVTLATNEVRRWSIPDRTLIETRPLAGVPEAVARGEAEPIYPSQALAFWAINDRQSWLWASNNRRTWCWLSNANDSGSVIWNELDVGRPHYGTPAAAVSPEGGLFALASPVAPPSALSPEVNHLAFGEQTLEIWDARLKQRRHRIATGHTRDITSLLFSPDAKLLASLSFDSVTRIWDVATGALVQTLRGHKRGTFGGAFSPDGRTLATVNDDSTMKLWHVGTGREVASFTLPPEAWIVAFSPDGRFLVTIGQNLLVLRAPTYEDISVFGTDEQGSELR